MFIDRKIQIYFKFNSWCLCRNKTPACNVTAIIVCNIAYEKNRPNCKTSDIYQTFSLA